MGSEATRQTKEVMAMVAASANEDSVLIIQHRVSWASRPKLADTKLCKAMHEPRRENLEVAHHAVGLHRLVLPQ